MKNFYLSFCKFATLALMVALTALFFQVKTSKIEAQGAPGNSGSIWTTLSDCGESSQDVNHYDEGDRVFINGANFDDESYDWEIKGQPGGASSDPNIVVASGEVTPEDDGSFCVSAYTVQPGDDGVYSVKVGNKGDNYSVDGESQVDLCANIDGNQESVPEGRYQDGENCPEKTRVCTDPDASNYDSEVGPTEIADNGVCQCLAAQSCPSACGQSATTVPDGQCGVTSCAATSACQDPTRPSMSSVVSCGQIEMTFTNPTRWGFSFDYRIDNEEGQPDAYSAMTIANGPWAGWLFGNRYNIVNVLAGQTENRTVAFGEDSGDHTVAYRLWRGPENDYYLDWVTREIDSDCEENIYGCTDETATNYDAEATHDDESCVYPSSSPSPSVSPQPTEPPGYTCPVAQSCSSACGQPAKDVPNGSCGWNHCDPTPACGEEGGVGGATGSTGPGQVLGSTTARVSTASGQVLGATTYAATGVAEDIAFAFMGMTGATLSSVGILLKKNAKKRV